MTASSASLGKVAVLSKSIIVSYENAGPKATVLFRNRVSNSKLLKSCTFEMKVNHFSIKTNIVFRNEKESFVFENKISEVQSCAFEIKQIRFKMKKVIFSQSEQWATLVVSEDFLGFPEGYFLGIGVSPATVNIRILIIVSILII